MIPNRNDEPDPMAATRASGVLGKRAFFNKIHQIFKIQKKKRGGGPRQPPLRAGRRPRASEARAAAPPLQASKCLLCPRLLEDCLCLVKGDIWLNSGHHLHLTNKGDPGTRGIIMVTSDVRT